MVRRSISNLKELAILTSLAGLLYCAWPLGYILNPLANQGLASNLQGSGQPYNWLFILLDVVCGAVVLYVAVELYRLMTVRPWRSFKSLTVLSFALFGFLTALDALLPVDCAADQNRCGNILSHPLVIIHGVVSIGSIAALAVSVLAGWSILRKTKQAEWLKLYSTFILASYFFFGLVTGLLIYTDRSSAFSQHVFIIICSLWIATLPIIVLKESQKNLSRKAQMAKNRAGV